MMCWMWAAVSEALRSELKSPWVDRKSAEALAGGEASDFVSPGREEGKGGRRGRDGGREERREGGREMGEV